MNYQIRLAVMDNNAVRIQNLIPPTYIVELPESIALASGWFFDQKNPDEKTDIDTNGCDCQMVEGEISAEKFSFFLMMEVLKNQTYSVTIDEKSLLKNWEKDRYPLDWR
jgi:hypothetical protein